MTEEHTLRTLVVDVVVNKLPLLTIPTPASSSTSSVTRVTSPMPSIATHLLIASGLAKRVEVTVPLVSPADTRRVGANVIKEARLVVGSSLALRLGWLLLLSDDTWVWGTFRLTKLHSILVVLFVLLCYGSLPGLTLLLESLVSFGEVKLGVWDGRRRDMVLRLPATVTVHVEIR